MPRNAIGITGFSAGLSYVALSYSTKGGLVITRRLFAKKLRRGSCSGLILDGIGTRAARSR